MILYGSYLIVAASQGELNVYQMSLGDRMFLSFLFSNFLYRIRPNNRV